MAQPPLGIPAAPILHPEIPGHPASPGARPGHGSDNFHIAPMKDATAAVVNAPTDGSARSTRGSTKRFCEDQGTSNPGAQKRSKRQASAQDWTGSPATASTVGVGPSSEPTSAQAEPTRSGSPGPAQTNAPDDFIPPPGVQPGPESRTQCDHSNSAFDVWYFCRALDTREEPAVRPNVEEEPVLTHKPKTPFVGCKLCKRWKTYKNTSDGGVTSTVRAHLKREHQETYEAICKLFAHQWGITQPDESQKKPRIGSDKPNHEKFTAGGLLYYLARWIVADDQSINVVEGEEFRDLLFYLRPDLEEQDVPGRTKLTEYILHQWAETKKAIIDELRTSPSRVHFTCDIWSDQELASYLAVTAHHTRKDEGSNMITTCSHLITFRRVYSHAGASIADVIFKFLKDAGLLWKIGMFTLDNASSNDSMMRELERLLAQEGIQFDSKGNRIRCFPHIINIAVQHILEELKKKPHAPLENPPATLTREQCVRIVDAFAADPVGKVRMLVSSCRQSDQRRVEFQRTIEEGNKAGLWKNADGETIKLPSLQLLRDCETRWSSTFLMLKRVFLLYPAIQTFLQHASRADISHVALSLHEYNILKDIYQVLEVAHDAQQLVSSERTPSLSIALPAYELILQAWIGLRQELPHLRCYIDKGISKIQEYVHKSRESRIYALAIMLNPSFKLHWIRDYWLPAAAVQAEEWLLDMLQDYRAKERSDGAKQSLRRSLSLPTSSSAGAASSEPHGLRRLLVHAQKGTAGTGDALRPHSSEPDVSSIAQNGTTTELTEAALRAEDRAAVKSEFDRYVSEGLISDIESGADLLNYWAMNRKVYPYLYQLALDVLPVQASAVACERVFSSSKETDTLRRSRIDPELMEALQCLKYNFKRARLNLSSH